MKVNQIGNESILQGEAIANEAIAVAVVGLGTVQAIWQAIVLDFDRIHISEEMTE